jgi:hypothetical protein
MKSHMSWSHAMLSTISQAIRDSHGYRAAIISSNKQTYRVLRHKLKPSADTLYNHWTWVVKYCGNSEEFRNILGYQVIVYTDTRTLDNTERVMDGA